MKKIYFVLSLLCLSAGTWAQVSLTNGTPTATIDFSNTTPTGVGSNPSTAYAGAGFEPATVTAGRLNSNAWAVTGWSNGALAFGGTQVTANTDYTRGATAVAVTTGGFYAFTGAPHSAADPAFMIQPGGSDWAPGTMTLRIQNNGTTNITQLAVSYNIYIRNDQGRSNSFNFSYSSDDVTYTPVAGLDYTSPAVADALGWVIVGTAPSRSTTITGLTIAPGAYVYIRWSGADAGGAGSRDEFGLDDINMTATFSSGGTPDIVLSSPNPAVPAGNIAQGSTSTTNNPIYRFDLAVTTADAVLNGVTINTAGTYAATDITNFKCWYSADATFSPGTDVLLSTKNTALGAGAHVFPAFTNQSILTGATGYIFITTDVVCAAVLANTINVTAITTADISFVSGNKSGTAFDGGLQTIIAATPVDVTAPAASVANASSSLSWTNPAGCYDEILIVAAAAANSGTPTGDGTAYFDDLIYGNGTALGNGFVVYKGNTSPQVVTALTNGTAYFYKFFTRLGTTWSAGVEISQTPALVSSATDYFRSVASGSWATLATWESSGDSTAWIAATLVPGALAAHVAVQSPDSVWLDANRTTANLTILSGAKMNAVTFTMTATARFNLLGTASYYQGGTVSSVPGVGVEQVLATTSNYHYNGTQNGISAALPEFGNLIYEPTPTGSNTFQNSTATAPFFNGLVVRGNMTINLGAAFQIRFATGATTSRTHTIDGDLNITGANTTVVVQQGANPSTTTGTLNIGGNLNISGGATFQSLSSTALNGGNSIVNLEGNINNNGGVMQTGASTAGFDTLNFMGASAQSINNTGGTFTFTNRQTVRVNNATGVTLNTPISIAGKIDFLSGIVTTTAVNLLTLTDGSVVAGAANASYVNGPVKKVGNTDFTFPVGKTGFGYVPIGVSNFAAAPATDEFTAEYMRGNARLLGPVTAIGLDHVSGCDYWILNRTGSATATDVTAYWSANNVCSGAYVDNLGDLVIAHFDGTNWDAFGTVGTATGVPAAGNVVWTGVTTFSPFALASVSFNNPLPITINFFTGMKQNGNHLLNWKVTCVSSPTANMELERSSDGRNYSGIYTKTATALQCQQPFNYTDAQPAAGVNYYRLKMTDANGKVTYSSVVSLINATRGIDVMNIAPNPIVGGRFSLRVSAAQNGKMDVIVTDMQGRLMQRQSTSLLAGFNQVPVNVSSLAAGSYQVSVMTSEGRASVQRFVIQ